MFWFFAALVLLSILSITVSHSGPIRVAGCVLLAALLSVGLYQRLTRTAASAQAAPRGRSVSPAAVVTPIGLELLSATQLVLTGGGGPFELRGRIANNSPDLQLTSVTVSLTRRDCHPGALTPGGCDTVWQDQHWMPMSIPAGEARDFSSAIWAHSPVPRTRGKLEDEITIVTATGQPQRR